MMTMSAIFQPAPFRRFDLGSHIRLGQNIFSSLLQDVGISDASFTSLVKDLPAELQDANRQKWDECKKMGLKTIKGAECAAALFASLKSGGASTAPTGVPVLQQQTPSSFPIIPVLIGLAAAGGLVYYLVTKGK
jgi:hypothetical protein